MDVGEWVDGWVGGWGGGDGLEHVDQIQTSLRLNSTGVVQLREKVQLTQLDPV